jgi:hypothetical protein
MDTQLSDLEQRVNVLETMLSTLMARLTAEATPPPSTTLVAPVRIVDAAGRVLVSIEQRPHDVSVRIINEAGIVTAALGVDGTQAGYLAIRNAEGTLVAFLDVELSGARLQLEDHQRQGGVILFGGDSGDEAGGGINIVHTAGGLSLSLCSTPDGGEVVCYDGQTQETVRAQMPTPSVTP